MFPDIIYYFLSGFIIASISSFSRLFSERLSRAFYLKSRKTIKNKWSYILKGRSSCDHCQRQLPLLFTLPVFGYIFSGGKCIYCREKILKSYFYEEILFFILGGLIYFLQGFNMLFLSFFSIYLVLCYIIGYIDFHFLLIPTEAIVFFIIFSVAEYLIRHNLFHIEWLDITVSLSWGALFFLLYFLSPDKMGFSDILLVFIYCFALGFPLSVFLPTIASILAIVYFLIKNRKLKWKEARLTKIPFGLFLSLAFLFMKIIPLHFIKY